MKPKTRSMKKLLALFALGAAVAGASGAVAGDPPARFDHRNTSGRQLLLRAAGTAGAEDVAARHGLTILDRFDGAGGALYLVEAPAGRGVAAALRSLAADSEVGRAEAVALASLPAQAASAVSLPETSPDLLRSGAYTTPCQALYLPGGVWAGFSDQLAARAVRLAEAHQTSASCGAGVRVAVIDTGVDETHPLLATAVRPGLDLLDPGGTGSDWANLDHSVRAIVEHSVRAIVEQSAPVVMAGGGRAVAAGAVAPVLGEPATVAAFEENVLPPYFGHGTMVAGLIRLVAPGAEIVPIRAFGGDGTASVYDLVRAIRWATDQGVEVINMSFSLEESSTELREAIRYAESHGVLMVGAVGNQGSHMRIYPAAYGEVLGAAAQSTETTGSLAAFSNWGAKVADLAAPGSAIVTTFPGGLYAAGWGTSFSSPLVAGAAALIYERQLGHPAPNRELRNDLMQSATPKTALNGKVISGQLDVYRAWQLAGN